MPPHVPLRAPPPQIIQPANPLRWNQLSQRRYRMEWQPRPRQSLLPPPTPTLRKQLRYLLSNLWPRRNPPRRPPPIQSSSPPLVHQHPRQRQPKPRKRSQRQMVWGRWQHSHSLQPHSSRGSLLPQPPCRRLKQQLELQWPLRRSSRRRLQLPLLHHNNPSLMLRWLVKAQSKRQLRSLAKACLRRLQPRHSSELFPRCVLARTVTITYSSRQTSTRLPSSTSNCPMALSSNLKTMCTARLNVKKRGRKPPRAVASKRSASASDKKRSRQPRKSAKRPTCSASRRSRRSRSRSARKSSSMSRPSLRRKKPKRRAKRKFKPSSSWQLPTGRSSSSNSRIPASSSSLRTEGSRRVGPLVRLELAVTQR